jgi:hypothetical protein
VHTAFDIQDARLVAPGAPERSLLFHRMQRRGHGQMPPIGTNLLDKPAVELMRDWIQQLPASVDTAKPDASATEKVSKADEK